MNTYAKLTRRMMPVVSLGVLLGWMPASVAVQTGFSIATTSPDVDVTTSGSTVSDADGYVTVSFTGHGSTPRQGVFGRVRTTIATGEGAFTGDYRAAGADGIAFGLMYSGDQASVAVEIVTGSGYRWLNSRQIRFGDTPDTWVEQNVSLDLAAGWERTDSRETPANWEAALADVQSIGLVMSQRGTTAQAVSVNAFRLLAGDEVITPDAVLQQRLFARFGVNSVDELTDEQLRLDSDGNGIPDWQEILITQTNPDDAMDGPFVNVRRTADGFNEVVWSTIANGRYRVLWSESPAGPWQTVRGADLIEALVQGKKGFVDPDTYASPMRFYRILQNPQTP